MHDSHGHGGGGATRRQQWLVLAVTVRRRRDEDDGKGVGQLGLGTSENTIATLMVVHGGEHGRAWEADEVTPDHCGGRAGGRTVVCSGAWMSPGVSWGKLGFAWCGNSTTTT
ncbi:hypothetical protein L1987_03388 [Smallanthus sonchifolius]|uniref:Uncharacterized protein n=1 Tax=Smallanthus sonchifolius TaxID=185202 RepID=A0ACB9KAM1_9ASTR|nr:hypothetical protein L1987_03388 [Smallanthus sonchifolius]